MSDFLTRLAHTPALPGQATSYAAAVVVIGLIVDQHISVAAGCIVLGFVAILIVLVAMRHDLAVVHVLVNSTHDALIARVDSLVAALTDAGVTIPDDPDQPKTAVADDNIEDPE